MQDRQSAAYLNDAGEKLLSGRTKTGDVLTSDLIYYMMFSLKIPIECQKWHLNRLLILIHIFNIKNSAGKRSNNRSILSNNAAINASRRKKYNTRG